WGLLESYDLFSRPILSMVLPVNSRVWLFASLRNIKSRHSTVGDRRRRGNESHFFGVRSETRYLVSYRAWLRAEIRRGELSLNFRFQISVQLRCRDTQRDLTIHYERLAKCWSRDTKSIAGLYVN